MLMKRERDKDAMQHSEEEKKREEMVVAIFVQNHRHNVNYSCILY
mgnify:CR=1 FL=1